MRRSRIIALVSLLIFILQLVSLNITSAQVPPSVPFRVEQVAWGTSTDNPTEVEPGDTNAPLTVDMRNLSNRTLRGVYGTLRLSEPFTDYASGGYNASAAGVPLESEDILEPTGEILPAGSFSLTYRLNIARNATPGRYDYTIDLDYFVKETNTTWLWGEPQTVNIRILLPNRPPTIDSFTPSTAVLTVEVGNSLNFTAKCSDPDNDTLTYEWKLDAVLVSNNTSYLFTSTDEDVGGHSLVLTVSDGRLTSSQTWTITVTTVPVSHFSVSSNYITAGFDNQLNITVSNNLWKGTVQASLTVPQPLIIRGNQSWTSESLEPSKNLSITARIFAPPTAIGSTLAGALTINYGDKHGLAYTDTYNVGLIVQGYVRLVVYDVVFNPQPIASGSEVTITATVLNTGSVIASYANVSLQSNPVLEVNRESSAYVGDIELNSPVPFTIVARVAPDVQNGTYPMVISLAYQDDQYREHVLDVATNLVVATGVAPPEGLDGTSGIVEFLSNGGWSILVIVGAGVVLLILYVRRLSRAKQMPKPT